MPGYAAGRAAFRGPAYAPDGTFAAPYTNRNPAPADIQAPGRPSAASLNMGLGSRVANLFRSGQVRREYVGGALKYEDAVGALTALIPKLLQQEPAWSLFANDFKVVDHSGEELPLRKFALLWALLPSLRSKLTLKSDVESLNVVDGRELPGIDTKIYASIKLTIDSTEPRFYHRFRKVREDIIGAIETEVVFSFNDKNEVSELHIEDFLFDHKMVQGWPDIDLTGVPASRVDLREWAAPRVSKILRWIRDRRGAEGAARAPGDPGPEDTLEASGGGVGTAGGAGGTPPPLAMA